MKKCKRFLALLLVVATLAALAVPSFAASSSFNDIKDEQTARNAEVLRLMGVVAGTGNNYFDPDTTLTRAQFCAMAVNFMGLGDEVVLHTTRTIFKDVLANHWARGYINLAASTTLGDGKDRLISGVGNGNFSPDAPITYAQAVTILLRMMGYSDSDVGAVWPQGYMNLAKSLNLTAGLNLSNGSALTRAQAAQLFATALSTRAKNGSPYYTTRAAKDNGSVIENVVILATNVTAADQTSGAISTSAGVYKPAVAGINPVGLRGCRGVLLLNDKKEMIAFVPDGSSSVVVTLSGRAQSAYLTGTNGIRYNISSDTPAYSSDSSADAIYADIWPDLGSGAQVTLYTDKGQVTAVYYSSSSSSTDAVVVTGNVSLYSFSALTGGATDFKIQKNRQNISLSDIQVNDVVTYDSVSNTLIVSDLRLACVYENVAPNTTSPSTIRTMGNNFEVLSSAWNTSSNMKLGDNVVLLLTADGKVAGIQKLSTGLRGNALGLVSGSKVLVALPNGATLTLSGGSIKPALEGHLVSVSSSKEGGFQASEVSGNRTSDSLDLLKMTLGSYTVAAGVNTYEKAPDGSLVPLSLTTLGTNTVHSDKIAYYRLNSSGYIDTLVFKPLTGDNYTYGIIIKGEVKEHTIVDMDDNGNEIITTVTSSGYALSHSGGLIDDISANSAGAFVGVICTSTNIYQTIALESYKISSDDFFTKDGLNYVSVNGKTYLVSDTAQGYISDSESWGSVSDARRFSADLTVYIDPIGLKVRIVATR